MTSKHCKTSDLELDSPNIGAGTRHHLELHSNPKLALVKADHVSGRSWNLSQLNDSELQIWH